MTLLSKGNKMKDFAVSKHVKNGRHVGFKKFVFGRNFHLISGTTADQERDAKAIARVLVLRADELWQAGQHWTKEIIDECFSMGRKDAAETAPTPATASHPPPLALSEPHVLHGLFLQPTATGAHTVYAAIEKYKEAEGVRDRTNKISHPHAVNNIYRIEWAKEGMTDRPLGQVTLHDLKDWTGFFMSRPVSEKTGGPISAYTVAGIVGCIGHFLDFCDAEQSWVPCHRWRDALKGANPKKLMTSLERNRQKREGFTNLKLPEAQILWKMGVPDTQAEFGLALWAGHTQNELATILLDGEFVEQGGDLYLVRDRHKTGVFGRWWIPPEVAAVVKKRIARTVRDPKVNPWQAAFLSNKKMPLVHFGRDNDKARAGWG
jgi:hypothetical protein